MKENDTHTSVMSKSMELSERASLDCIELLDIRVNAARRSRDCNADYSKTHNPTQHVHGHVFMNAEQARLADIATELGLPDVLSPQ